MDKLEKVYKKFLKHVLSLPDTVADPAVYVLTVTTILSYSRCQQFNLCYQTNISLIFCCCSGSFSTSNQINAYKSSIYCICKKRGLMAVYLISWFSFNKQILYLLKIIFANHLQTEAD